jgi:hypothetical protein
MSARKAGWLSVRPAQAQGRPGKWADRPWAWQHRYFQLGAGELVYYTDPSLSTKCGAFGLRDGAAAVAAAAATTGADGEESVLQVTSCGVQLCLRGTEPELREWAEAVRAEIKEHYVARKSGWLLKRTVKSSSSLKARTQYRNWKKRYFVLCRGSLTYYGDEQCAYFKGEFPLAGSVALRDHYSSVPNLLVVRSSAFALKLQASSRSPA